MVRKLQIAAGVLIVILFIIIPALLSQDKPQPDTLQRVVPASRPDTTGFQQASKPAKIRFPADHGPHPAYQTEWWYYTGNLQTEDGRHFGFQLTFFRRALLPPGASPGRASDWATSQVYMAHFAVSDIDGESYRAHERLARGAAGLAGASAEPFGVWLENWQVEQIDAYDERCPPDLSAPCGFHLHAAEQDLAVDLELLDTKGPNLQGDRGYSQKGPQSGQASYYYSLTRMQATGQITMGDEVFPVSGMSWMDHEWSTSALSPEQKGWDWFSLQFEDGTELMVFQIRQADGSIDPYSSGMLIAVDGRTRQLSQDEFNLEVTGNWTSPHSGAVYPAGWVIQIPGEELELEIKPLMKDQELDVSYAYWEGAVQASGTRAGLPISGKGYVELTGYSGSMGGQF
jgi:predicted secreted hydrolase